MFYSNIVANSLCITDARLACTLVRHVPTRLVRCYDKSRRLCLQVCVGLCFTTRRPTVPSTTSNLPPPESHHASLCMKGEDVTLTPLCRDTQQGFPDRRFAGTLPTNWSLALSTFVFCVPLPVARPRPHYSLKYSPHSPRTALTRRVTHTLRTTAYCVNTLLAFLP